jgi:hypothetical protein
MATATQKERAARQVARRAKAASESAAITFLVIEDNSGRYRWTILDGGGESLAQSGAFGTYDAAHDAAGVVRDAAGSARFEPRPAAERAPTFMARPKATKSADDSDPERWLDEGSRDGEAVRPWRSSR